MYQESSEQGRESALREATAPEGCQGGAGSGEGGWVGSARHRCERTRACRVGRVCRCGVEFFMATTK